VSSSYSFAGGGSGGGAVDSVNEQTGAVVLDAGDVGADPAGTATSAVSGHSADTTAVHGITDTSALETTSGSTAKVSAHTAASDPHGDRAYVNSRNTLSSKTVDESQSTTTLDDIDNLGIAVGTGTYEFEFVIPYQTSVTGNGIALSLAGPTTSFCSYTIEIQSANTTTRSDYQTVFGTTGATNGAGTANTTFTARISGRVVTTASGTLQPRYAIGSGAASTATIKAGAYGKVTSLA
jgi:hypothetical protein